MATANKVLEIARAELGYKEGSNNNNKYGIAYGLNNQPWCVIFVWWVFRQAGMAGLFYGGGKVASCRALYAYHKGKGQAVSKAALKAGDIVFFDFSSPRDDTDHVGIVESVSGNTITTIEGNTSSGSGGSQSNGDGVYRRQRSTAYITAAYRPAYDAAQDAEAPQSTPADNGSSIVKSLQIALNKRGAGLVVDGIIGPKTRTAMTKYLVRVGSKGDLVRWVQARLIAAGYSVGSYGVDGIFGAATLAAVRAFQRAQGLAVDGVAGIQTYSALL